MRLEIRSGIDKSHKTTKSFIDAIGKIGYEYAIKATSDLQSTRESDVYFKNQIINNASIDALPYVEDILTLGSTPEPIT